MHELSIDNPRGVLARPLDGTWTLRRWAPSAPAAAYVSWYWSVSWSRVGLDPHVQATLPHPSAHLSVEHGEALLYGPRTRRFERVLDGEGRVIAARLRPGALRPLIRAKASTWKDLVRPASALPGFGAARLVAQVEAEPEPARAVEILDAMLVSLLPGEPDLNVSLADRAVALLGEDRSITRVEHLSERLGMSVRTVHRLFSDYVGVGASWVIRRIRIQEVAARVAERKPIDWAAVAAELGYFDQAHLVRDFTATVGMSPTRYARSFE